MNVLLITVSSYMDLLLIAQGSVSVIVKVRRATWCRILIQRLSVHMR